MKTEYRITRNYLDRSSPFKWLVRKAGESTSMAIHCKEVTAKNVRFMESDHQERALGCAIVAVTDELPIMVIAEAGEPIKAEADPDHNPRNVPADKIPAGYRLARESEIDGKRHEGSKVWGAYDKTPEFRGAWNDTEGAWHAEVDTIIVPLPPAPIVDANGFPPPPEGHEWSNPDNVKVSKIPEGYRLGVVAENDEKEHKGTLFWDGDSFTIQDTYDGTSYRSKDDTWIIPISIAFPEVVKVETPAPAIEAAAPELTKLEYIESGCLAKGFYKHGTSEHVQQVKELHLKADGGVFGILA